MYQGCDKSHQCNWYRFLKLGAEIANEFEFTEVEHLADVADNGVTVRYLYTLLHEM